MDVLREVPWTEITALIQAMASLAWPALVLVLIILFVKDIKALLPRVSSAEALGVKVKLTKQLDRLATAAELLPIGRGSRPLRAGRGLRVLQADSPYLLSTFGGSDQRDASPKETMMQVAARIEDHLRWALERTGVPADTVAMKPWPEVLRLLRERGTLPATVLDSAAAFREVRNEIVHGRGADEDDEIRAVDIGVRILDAIRGLPGAEDPFEKPRMDDPA